MNIGKINKLRGIFPVIPSLFHDDNTLDLESQRKVVQFALNAGSHGVVFPGVASEYNFLTSNERGRLMALVAEEIDGRIPIVGGASAPSAKEVIAAGRQAEENGIRILMVMAPNGLGKDLDVHRRFFTEIGEGLPDAEIMLQNAPAPIGAGLAAEKILELVASNTNISYVKEETLPSGPSISGLRHAGIPHLKGVFGGGGARYIIDELSRGAHGAMPAIELADLHVALYNAFSSAEAERARQLYRDSLPLLVSQSVYRMRLTKYVLSKRGITPALHVRAPLPELDEFTRQDVDQMLSDLKAVIL
ncbi:MAG: dihydrodipicolinate synthase family protein [Verrucomicrobia bacterium]|jgi:4-hydroxy-tetrahydrodipicolinate synthase|nr:dihydrodipicolinate synthase family protein [Verrucomicrobiota bacterium]MBT6237744.1 dihydrodipicolinate synthase family protein [Verrucomicrobiota bacterium]MBT7875043.1 dihydrodipicolinate synthase family protein [Verrucomicrobiota bacterium]